MVIFVSGTLVTLFNHRVRHIASFKAECLGSAGASHHPPVPTYCTLFGLRLHNPTSLTEILLLPGCSRPKCAAADPWRRLTPSSSYAIDPSAAQSGQLCDLCLCKCDYSICGCGTALDLSCHAGLFYCMTGNIWGGLTAGVGRALCCSVSSSRHRRRLASGSLSLGVCDKPRRTKKVTACAVLIFSVHRHYAAFSKSARLTL